MPYNNKKKSRGPSYSSNRSFHTNNEASSFYPEASVYYKSNRMIPNSSYRSFENGQNHSSHNVPEYQNHSFPFKMPEYKNNFQDYQGNFRKHINNMNARFNSSSLLVNCPDRNLNSISGGSQAQERSSTTKDFPETGSQTSGSSNAKQANSDGFHSHPDKLNDIFNNVLGPESVSNKAGSAHNHQSRQNNSNANISSNNTGSKKNNNYFPKNNRFNRRREAEHFRKYNAFSHVHTSPDIPRDIDQSPRDRYQSSRGRGQRPSHYNNSYRPEEDWGSPRNWSQSSRGHQQQGFDSLNDSDKRPLDRKKFSSTGSDDIVAGNLLGQCQTKNLNSSLNVISPGKVRNIIDEVFKSSDVVPLFPASVQINRPPSRSSVSSHGSHANRGKEFNDLISSVSKPNKTIPELVPELKKSTARFTKPSDANDKPSSGGSVSSLFSHANRSKESTDQDTSVSHPDKTASELVTEPKKSTTKSTKLSDANGSNTPASVKSAGKLKAPTKSKDKQPKKSSVTKATETMKKKLKGNSQSPSTASSKTSKSSACVTTNASKNAPSDSQSAQPATSSSNNAASSSTSDGKSAAQSKRPMTKVELLKLITPRSRKDQQQVERLMKEYNKNKEKIPSTISSPLNAADVEGSFSLDHLDLASLDLKALKSDIPEELSDTINRVFNLSSTARNPIILDEDDAAAAGKASSTTKKKKGSQPSRKRRASDTAGSLSEGKKAKLRQPDVCEVQLNEQEGNEASCDVEEDDHVPTSSSNEVVENSETGNDTSFSAVSNLLSSSSITPSENILGSLLQISLKEEEIQCNISQLDFDIQHLHACIVEFSQKLNSKKHFREMLLNEEKRLKSIRIQVLKASANRSDPNQSQMSPFTFTDPRHVYLDSISSSGGSNNAAVQQLIHHQLLGLDSSSHLHSDNYDVDSGVYFGNNALPCLDGVINIQPLNDVSDSDVGGAEVVGEVREEPGRSSANPISVDLTDFDGNSFTPILSPPTDNPSQVRYLGVVNGLSDLLRRSGAKETVSRPGTASAESRVSLQSPVGRKTPASSTTDVEAALL